MNQHSSKIILTSYYVLQSDLIPDSINFTTMLGDLPPDDRTPCILSTTMMQLIDNFC